MTDLFIAAAPKDYEKLPWVLQAAATYLPTIHTAHVVTPDKQNLNNLIGLRVRTYTDDEVLQIPRDIFPYRPNWIFQQMLKLFQNVTEDEYLVLDADTILLAELELHKEDKPVFYVGRDQPEGAYHEFNRRFLGIGRPYPHSLISECTLYERKYVWEMLRYMRTYTVDRFCAWAASQINVLCHPAESELYGAFITIKHPEDYIFHKLIVCLNGRYNGGRWDKDEVQRLIDEQTGKADVLSIHSWEGQIA